jgi:2,4-dienoyl-CoA reductase-like NADH-dependent reductase (Old Yellow Enzyme family)
MMEKKPFEPAVVGGIEVKNRIFRSATYEGVADAGRVTGRYLDVHRKLAEGGIGLIITGWIGFAPTDNATAATLAITPETPVGELRRLTDEVHAHGTKIVAQLNHAGSQIFHRPDKPVYGPSALPDPVSKITPESFSTEQVRDLVRAFGEAAVRAQEGGFDGVELHGAHGYLLNRFLSAQFNIRTDAYGGTQENRGRIVREILGEIRRRCGEEFPVWIKLNSSDFSPAQNGFGEADFLAVGRELARAGIDAIEVSGGAFYGQYTPCRNRQHRAYHLESAKTLAAAVDVSLILVGGIRDLESVQQVLGQDGIEAVSLSRALIREPDLVRQWSSGNTKEADCVACNGCFNPNGTICIFQLEGEKKAAQMEFLKQMTSQDRPA